jgi:hypothetical protein
MKDWKTLRDAGWDVVFFHPLLLTIPACALPVYKVIAWAEQPFSAPARTPAAVNFQAPSAAIPLAWVVDGKR